MDNNDRDNSTAETETWTLGSPRQSIFGAATEWLLKDGEGYLIAKVYDEVAGRAILDARAKARKLETVLRRIENLAAEGAENGADAANIAQRLAKDALLALTPTEGSSGE